MKKAIMKRWVKALRSRKYVQDTECLKSKDEDTGEERFCALGVLCELYNPKKWVWDKKMEVFHYERLRKQEGLSRNVMEWAGIKTRLAELTIDSDEYEIIPFDSIATQNDVGQSFEELADIIEEHYKRL